MPYNNIIYFSIGLELLVLRSRLMTWEIIFFSFIACSEAHSLLGCGWGKAKVIESWMIKTCSSIFQFSSPQNYQLWEPTKKSYIYIYKDKKLILCRARRILHQSLATSRVVKIGVEVLLQGAQQESRLLGCAGSRFEGVMV